MPQKTSDQKLWPIPISIRLDTQGERKRANLDVKYVKYVVSSIKKKVANVKIIKSLDILSNF